MRFFLILFIFFTSNVYSLDDNLINLKKEAYKEVQEILENKEFSLPERKENISKIQDRVYVKKAVQGYLGAQFTNDIKKIPFSFSFIIEHTSYSVLNSFLKVNNLKKIIENKKNIKNHFNLNINNIYFNKSSSNVYELDVKYSLSNYEQKFYFNRKITISITSRTPFDFLILKDSDFNL